MLPFKVGDTVRALPGTIFGLTATFIGGCLGEVTDTSIPWNAIYFKPHNQSLQTLGDEGGAWWIGVNNFVLVDPEPTTPLRAICCASQGLNLLIDPMDSACGGWDYLNTPRNGRP